jgi:ribosomal protein S17E
VEFVADKLKETVETGGQDKVKNVISGYLTTGLLNLANGENDSYYGHFKLAEKVFEYYQDKISRAETNRVSLPPMEFMKQETLKEIFGPPPRGFHPYLQERLRTVLKLPADAYKSDPNTVVTPATPEAAQANTPTGAPAASTNSPTIGKPPPSPTTGK